MHVMRVLTYQGLLWAAYDDIEDRIAVKYTFAYQNLSTTN